MADDGERTFKPRLRFPEFVGAPDWREKPLAEICEINPEHTGLPDSFVYIDLESVEAGMLNAKKRIERKAAPSRAQRLLKNGDVVFQIVRPYQRNNLFVQFEDNDAYVASTGYAQLRANESKSFLFQVVHTDGFVDRVIAKCTGSNYPAINSSDLACVLTPVPPSLAEQQKIADCLTSLDEVIAAQRRKEEALKAHKKGLMQQLFPREGETLPRLRFPEFRDEPAWVAKKIGSMLEETPRPIEMADDMEYSLVTVRRRYGGVVSRERLKGKAIKVKSQFIVRTDDFLISKRQIVHDACGLVPRELDGSIVSNEYSVLGPTGGCDIRFFSYFAQQPAISKSFLSSSVGIVIEKMLFKLNAWLDLEFPFPSLAEQRRIAACLSFHDARIAAEFRRLDALKMHRRGLMQQLFPSLEGDR